jgi:hypothetical protein
MYGLGPNSTGNKEVKNTRGGLWRFNHQDQIIRSRAPCSVRGPLGPKQYNLNFLEHCLVNFQVLALSSVFYEF